MFLSASTYSILRGAAGVAMGTGCDGVLNVSDCKAFVMDKVSPLGGAEVVVEVLDVGNIPSTIAVAIHSAAATASALSEK